MKMMSEFYPTKFGFLSSFAIYYVVPCHLGLKFRQRVQLLFTNKTYNITHYGLVA